MDSEETKLDEANSPLERLATAKRRAWWEAQPVHYQDEVIKREFENRFVKNDDKRKALENIATNLL